MKRILTALALAFTLSAAAQTQSVTVTAQGSYTDFQASTIESIVPTEPLTVNFYDGTSTEIAGAEAVDFQLLPQLTGEVEIDGVVYPVDSVAERISYSFNPPSTFANDFTIYAGDQVVAFTTIYGNFLAVTVNGEYTSGSHASKMQISRSKLNSVVGLSLDARYRLMTEGEGAPLAHRVRVEVSQDPTTTYTSRNVLTHLVPGQTPTAYTELPIKSALLVPGVQGVSSPVLLFGDAEGATDAAGLRQGTEAYAITVPQSYFQGGVVNLSEQDSYTFVHYDYTAGTTTNINSSYSGYIGLMPDPEGGDKLFIYAYYSTDDLSTSTVDYFGTPLTVDSAEGIEPDVAATDNIVYCNADGVEQFNEPITEMQTITRADGLKYFYFLTAGSASVDDTYATPCIMVDPAAVINQGTVSLAGTEAPNFSIKFKAFNLSWPKNEWVPIPDNGTLNITENADGTTEFTLSVRNSYTNMGYPGGSQETLTIHFRGAESPYTGTNN